MPPTKSTWPETRHQPAGLPILAALFAAGPHRAFPGRAPGLGRNFGSVVLFIYLFTRKSRERPPDKPKYTNDCREERACYRPKQYMHHWKAILAYDGTDFHGWQIQPGLRTVQGTLSDALHQLVAERVLPQGSGRTDAGVHALGQVASFALQAPIPAPNLLRALNRLLPGSIRIRSVEPASPDFHARHTALRKTYEYRIFPLRAHRQPGTPPRTSPPASASESAHDTAPPPEERICCPTLARFVWDCPLPLALPAMRAAAAHILGTHDFTSFAAADPDLANRSGDLPRQQTQDLPAERTISHSEWTEAGDLLLYRVTGTGFLHHMVRNLVGTFAEAGCGRTPPDRIPAILAARDRSAAGPTAPARGLFLISVEYP